MVVWQEWRLKTGYRAQGYLRDVTATDLSLLCPVNMDPLDDPTFGMPAPGPRYEPEAERAAKAKQQQQRRPASSLKPKAEPEERSKQADQQLQQQVH